MYVSTQHINCYITDFLIIYWVNELRTRQKILIIYSHSWKIQRKMMKINHLNQIDFEKYFHNNHELFICQNFLKWFNLSENDVWVHKNCYTTGLLEVGWVIQL